MQDREVILFGRAEQDTEGPAPLDEDFDDIIHDQGITLVVDEIDSILKILRQEDMVGFRPWPDKYMDRDGVTSQMWLPHIGDVSREIYWKIIKNTTWHKQKEAWPNE